MSDKTPMYREGSAAIESEIKRMTELEWPLEVSAELLPADLKQKTLGDVGAGPNPNLGKLVRFRGGKYVALDSNLTMAKLQVGSENRAVQGDVVALPFADKSLDILHTRFVIMNLPENLRVGAIKELFRCGKENIIMDYNWEKFTSSNPTVLDFVAHARRVAEFAGVDLDHGAKLEGLVQETLLGIAVGVKIFNQGPIRNYSTLVGLTKSMQGLIINLENIEKQRAGQEGRPVNEALLKELDGIKITMEECGKEFAKLATEPDESKVPTFTPPDIVAVTF